MSRWPENNNNNMNYIKLGRAFKLIAYLLCLYILLEGLQVELTIMDMFSTVIELFFVMTHWDNPIILLYGTSKKSWHLGLLLTKEL